jgi:hypothetical protein
VDELRTRVAFARSLVDALTEIEGVVAVVLGVSYAHRTQHAYSYLDLGVYYTEAAPFSLEEIRVV